jgi:hypothetical protein
MFLNEGNSIARRPTMTPNTNTARVAETASVTAAVEVAAAEQLLRDMAYVLKLTRRVKEEMTADRAPTPARAARTGEGVLVA